MNRGWISLHRKILDNPILSRSKTYSRFEAFVYMLLKANHKNNKAIIGNQKIEVKKGSFITSQKQLMVEFNWGSTKLRAFLDLLKSDSMVEIKANSISTYITICNYSDYQNFQTENKLKSKRKQNGIKSQSKTNNNVVNNVNKDNNDNKEQNFINKVLAEGLKKTPMVNPEIIDDFCNYWTEKNMTGNKMKFQLEKTFDIKRRLNRWLKNQKDWNIKVKKPAVGFKTTSSGHYIGYCDKCNVSSFYKEYDLSGSSICCSDKIMPERKKND